MDFLCEFMVLIKHIKWKENKLVDAVNDVDKRIRVMHDIEISPCKLELLILF